MVLLTEILPGTLSSSSSTHDHNHRYIYDVFLSFRGADTRNRFTDHLYNALVDAGIVTFLDDEEIETGESLKPELENAIKLSRASIIVLSKNYASSTWCLDELVLILDQKRNNNQIVFPIFHDVEPTNVRKQQGSFGDAMAMHKQRMEAETNEEKRSELAQKMELWKMALTQVADLKGKDAKNRKETEFVKEVVSDIHRRLRVPLSHTLPCLVGMEYYIDFIGSWLTDGSCHVADFLTIIGMGGIGKTSLAKYVFQLHFSKFNKSSFIEGINARCEENFNGLLDLQKQLCRDISKNIPLQVNDVSVYTSMIKNVLAHKKVLLVLDDVSCLDQLDALLGNEAFYQGSKIIITTKDASLTERYALFNPQVQPKHKKVTLNGLHDFASLELLCIHAFQSHISEEGYEGVLKELVKYCEGHPLALEVLGRSLQKKDVTYWKECIKVLKKEPHSRINKVLKMSFDSLPFENDKELFKHIACFFVGMDRDVTQTILDACDINALYGITNLIDKCLLSIRWNNKLMMHQLIQEMGRDLVRQEARHKPWERSRLWCHEEAYKVLEQKKGTENIVGFALDMRMLEKEKLVESLHTDALMKMENLKLLQLNYVKMSGTYMNIPKQLRWLSMHGFHFKSIPLELPMENLVALDMSHSNIESFDMSSRSSERFFSRLKGLIGLSSTENRLLGSLKVLDLSFCEQLHSIGGFYILPSLERLIVRNCVSLVKVCESVEQCVELVHVDLSYCYNLTRFPILIGKLTKVKKLLLDGCIRESQIETIPSDMKLIAFSLPRSLRILSLESNNLSNESFPTDFSCLSMLEELYLNNNPIVCMPDCVRSLPRLQLLDMFDCDMVISIEHPPRMLRNLSVNAKVRKIKFHPEMSPLSFFGGWQSSSNLSTEVELDGMVKIQCIANVEERVLRSLGWTNLEFVKETRFREESLEYQTQMFYEFGIFSTFYWGDTIPKWINLRNKGLSISFTIPLSLKSLRGFNFCCKQITKDCVDYIVLPMIKVTNITKNNTWIYHPYIPWVKLDGTSLVSLSHWMFGPNEIKGGDHITITVADQYNSVTDECGISLVYEDGSMGEEEEKEEEEDAKEDVLGYYKSWNHIIGGDLSDFQLTTGEYFLDYMEFRRFTHDVYNFNPFVDDGAKYKEEEVRFKAFSQKKPEICPVNLSHT